MRTFFLWAAALGVVVAGAAGCDSDDGGAQAAVDADASADAATSDTSVSADTSATEETVTVAVSACCLSMSDGAAVWSEDGDLWMYSSRTGKRSALVLHPAIQKDPVVHDDLLVFADDRGGDFDLWALRLDVPGQPYALVEAPGDQDQPTLSEGRIAWVDRRVAPHGARQAEIWSGLVASVGDAAPVTSDEVEQTQPHVSGDRLVWADFTASGAGQYIDETDPAKNNADIFGWDFGDAAGFVVTDNDSKQLRPAISGDDVVWLDWRGINPEPKYSEFKVYTLRLGVDVERMVAQSSWARPNQSSR